MNVLIFGYGTHDDGFDSAMYFLSRGDNVRITDIRSRDSLGESLDYLEKLGAVIHCSGHQTEDFTWADLVIKNPSIRLDNEFLSYAKRTENDITFAYSRREAKKLRIICVTGARFKTTTASALCHALNEMGHSAHMCGNMGISAFSEIQKWDDGNVPEFLIIEMSTWIARDIYHFLKNKVPHVEVSVVTSVFESQDHSEDALNRIGEFNLHANYIVCPEEVKDAVEKIAAKKAKFEARFRAAMSSADNYAFRGTAWQLVNAYTDVITHAPLSGKSTLDSQFIKVTFGNDTSKLLKIIDAVAV